MSFIKEENDNDNDATSRITNNDIDEFITSSDELSREITTNENTFLTNKPTFNTKRYSLNNDIHPKPTRVQRTCMSS